MATGGPRRPERCGVGRVMLLASALALPWAGPVAGSEAPGACTGDPSPAPSAASGSAEALAAWQPIAPALNVRVASATAAQEGPGSDSSSVPDAAVLPPEALPVVGAVMQGHAVRSHVAAEVDGPAATAQAVSDLVGLDLLGGLVTAGRITAAATARADDAGASWSPAGSGFTDLRVLGEPVLVALPHARITLPADVFGPDSYVAFFEHDGFAQAAAAGASDASSAFVEVSLVHVHATDVLFSRLTDVPPLGLDEQSAFDVWIGNATASARHVVTGACPPTMPSVEGGAAVAVAHASPPSPQARAGAVGIPSSGGADSQAIGAGRVGTPGGLLASWEAGSSASTGDAGTGSAVVTSRVHALRACVLPDALGGCLVAAGSVAAVAAAFADPVGASQEGSTELAGLMVDGIPWCPVAPSADGVCRPAPDTMLLADGHASVVLNEQEAEVSGSCGGALTVGALHAQVASITSPPLPPLLLPPVLDVVVGQSHAGASWCQG